MGTLGGDHGDDRALAVVIDLRADAERGPHRGFLAVSADDQAGMHGPAVIKGEHGVALAVVVQRLEARRGDDIDMRLGCQPVTQCRDHRRVGHHIAQRRQIVFVGGHRHTAEMTGLGDMQTLDGGRGIGHRSPQIQRLEHGPRAPGQGRGACPEIVIGRRIEGHGLDQGHRQAGIGQRTGQARPGQPATDDGDIVFATHVGLASLIRVSMSSGFLTTSPVNTSGPAQVMSTSSSIRMPMPR